MHLVVTLLIVLVALFGLLAIAHVCLAARVQALERDNALFGCEDDWEDVWDDDDVWEVAE